MVDRKNNLVFLFLIFIFSGCGGVIGNIDRYKFDFSKDVLDSLVAKIFIKFPELNIPDSSIYKEDNGIKLCMIQDGERKIVFGFCTLNYYPNSNEINNPSELVLTHAGEYGDILEFDKNISFIKKYSYKKLFRSKFISKLIHD